VLLLLLHWTFSSLSFFNSSFAKKKKKCFFDQLSKRLGRANF
jgi:hypothetical protein